MASGLVILFTGFMLGMRHATDPDHVIAVSTIVSRERSFLKSMAIGGLWGVGHSVTIFLVGAAIILLGLSIPVRVGLTMDFSVGLMLIVLGLMNLTGTTKWLSEKFSPAHPTVTGEHAHLHGHGPKIHFHWHSHGSETEHHRSNLVPTRWFAAPLARLGLYGALRPLLVGVVHGLAGSAAVALLVLSTIDEPRWAVFYLLVFGLGTIAGMMLITTAMVFPLSQAGNRFAWLSRGLITGSGLVSVAFGLFVCYQIGFMRGLFTGHPTWKPS